MRLTTWTSTDCLTKGFGCAARSAAIVFRFIATARPPGAVGARLRGPRNLRDANQPRLGLGRAPPQPDRHRRRLRSSSRSLRICPQTSKKSISLRLLAFASSQIFPRLSPAGSWAICPHRKKGDAPSTSILSRFQVWRTSPRRRRTQDLRSSILLPTWICRRPSTRPEAPTFLHRCRIPTEARSTYRLQRAPPVRGVSSRLAMRSTCPWH